MTSPEVLLRLRSHARDRPDALALTGAADGDKLTYQELVNDIDRIAPLLESESVVILICNRHPRAASWAFAALEAYCLVLICDPRQGAARLREVADRFDDPLFVCDEFGRRQLDQGNPSGETSPRRWASLLSFEASSLSSKVSVSPSKHSQAPAIVLATSGSTGRPKLVVVSAAQLATRAGNEVAWFNMGERAVTLGVLPWSFDVGLVQLCSTLWAGGRHHLVQSWLPADLSAAIGHVQATGIAATPAIWKSALALDAGLPFWQDIRCLQFVTISAGELGEENTLELESRVGAGRIFKTYGQTEFFRIASLRPEDLHDRPGSVGRPYKETNFAVLSDCGRLADAGVRGEVVAWGSGLMDGYLGEVAASGPAHPNDPEVLLHRTGDFGFIDAQGFLTLAGRRDNMIKRQDQRMYLEELEDLARSATSAADIAFVALSESHVNGRLVACVADHTWNGRETEFRRALRSHVPGRFLPDRVILLSDLPKTLSGKLDRYTLSKLVTKGGKL